eukprot:8122651-Karenia_brevis.AAC.1
MRCLSKKVWLYAQTCDPNLSPGMSILALCNSHHNGATFLIHVLSICDYGQRSYGRPYFWWNIGMVTERNCHRPILQAPVMKPGECLGDHVQVYPWGCA